MPVVRAYTLQVGDEFCFESPGGERWRVTSIAPSYIRREHLDVGFRLVSKNKGEEGVAFTMSMHRWSLVRRLTSGR